MYLKHFALTHFPFDKPPQPEALFESNALQESRVRLQHLLDLRGIGLLTGEPGNPAGGQPGRVDTERRTARQTHGFGFLVGHQPDQGHDQHHRQSQAGHHDRRGFHEVTSGAMNRSIRHTGSASLRDTTTRYTPTSVGTDTLATSGVTHAARKGAPVTCWTSIDAGSTVA